MLPPLDLGLLAGFRFRCRPDCGLCCFAEPAVTASEAQRLIQLEPELPLLEGEGGWSSIEARPNGGACALLTNLRCRAHAARPAPCSEFPVTVHVGERAQATVVLSCPGIDPSGLVRWAEGPPKERVEPDGLGGEIESAQAEWARSGSVRELDRHRVRFRGRVAADSLAGWKASLHRTLPWPDDGDFPPEDPPDADDGLDELPVTFSERHGRVAFASHPGGWMLLQMSERGEEPATLGVVPPPDAPPALTPDGDRLLSGYLHYLVERDDALDAALAEPAPEGPVQAAVEADLVRTAATALARASVLHRADGGDGPLRASEVWAGIRATDAEWLDRPTTGRRF